MSWPAILNTNPKELSKSLKHFNEKYPEFHTHSGMREVKMVDVTEALESEFVTKDLVTDATEKKGVVTAGGSYETDEYDGKKNRKLTIGVDFNGKIKKYRPNKDGIKNLARAWGNNTESWVGKTILFSVVTLQGQERIQALPSMENRTETLEGQ